MIKFIKIAQATRLYELRKQGNRAWRVRSRGMTATLRSIVRRRLETWCV